MVKISKTNRGITKATKNKVAKIKAKADAYITKSKGKAIKNQSKLRETELTKRSLGRSAAISNAASQIAKSNRDSEASRQFSTKPWNDIINNSGGSTTTNKGTSDNSTDSTTQTDRVS